MTTEVTYLAGGCFWGMEDLIRKETGVKDVDVGYMGGDIPNATYNLVKTGTTGHAETVKITFDPSETSFENILLFYFKIHDPTTMNRQGNDIGSQYRSAIFYVNDQQKEIAEKVKARVDKSGVWGKPLATEISKAKEFWRAEEFHQDYLQKYPDGYTCHYMRDVKF
jgi:methionine-S-sulfoxide reductase